MNPHPAPASLDLLPFSEAGALLNMVRDWLLLEQYPHPANARLRFYGWTEDAFTFGYAQRMAEVGRLLPPGVTAIRRPTGGGVVDHRHDLTYALVIPAPFPMAQAAPCAIYRQTHQSLAAALLQMGRTASLAPSPRAGSLPIGPAVCFSNPSPNDVICPQTGQKLGGAALKRTRQGVLLQGSIDRRRVPGPFPLLAERFASALGQALGCSLRKVEAPAYPKPVQSSLLDSLSDPLWTRTR